ncbi:MAG: preprotein translocase subunit SecE [Clostridia bacterium]|nr:preprotein translocase subunit SecE [Clostridia bacterium]
MKTSKILAVILAAMLMLTLLTANVFADEVTGEAAAETTAEVAGDATEAPAEETEAPAEDDHDDHDHEGETEDEHDHSINWVDIIVSASIIVLAVLAFVICYFAIPSFKEKVKKFFSDYKSEFKKVTWSSKEDVRRNTITVIVVIVALVIVIALLDVIFSGGIEALSHLI